MKGTIIHAPSYKTDVQTSTSFMTGTGLKKWRPPNLSFLLVTLAISVMGREEVLLANTVVLNRENKMKEMNTSP